MKIIAIIPCKGREPLLYYTVKRLTRQGIHVICVGHTESEAVVVKAAGGEFYMKKESEITVGGKWQLALDKARRYLPDAVLYLGSSDWVSDNWCDVLYKDLEKGFAVSGQDGCYMVDIQEENKLRAIHWGGYDPKRSYNSEIKDSDAREIIGIGRLFGKEFLDMCNWQLFDVAVSHGIDFTQMVTLWKYKKHWKAPLMICHNTNKDIRSLSISTYRWPNKHKFDNEAKYMTAKDISNPEAWVSKYFPELSNLFNI